ncbi:GntR family transcriptional regulator [Lentibacillus halophilus]|uniref:GntR family transcriptional regulator n=1 Tax=Lentibacillus halophilus TaxID=295065 RepID=A0ABN0Z5G9_9BACI
MHIEKNPSLPDVIYKKILDMIKRGDFEIGEKLAGEKELAKMLNVSRTALREALQQLEMDGCVDRRHGVGTFVISAMPQMTAGLEKLESITDFIRMNELEPGTIKITIKEGQATKQIADSLGLNEGDDVIHFERVRTADQQPFAFDIAIGSPAMIGKNFTKDDQGESIFNHLENDRHMDLTHSYCNIWAENATPMLADTLNIETGKALQVLEQVYYTKGNKPVYYGKSYIRNDVLNFHLIRRR